MQQSSPQWEQRVPQRIPGSDSGTGCIPSSVHLYTSFSLLAPERSLVGGKENHPHHGKIADTENPDHTVCSPFRLYSKIRN